jgi:hypothetical protein
MNMKTAKKIWSGQVYWNTLSLYGLTNNCASKNLNLGYDGCQNFYEGNQSQATVTQTLTPLA